MFTGHRRRREDASAPGGGDEILHELLGDRFLVILEVVLAFRLLVEALQRRRILAALGCEQHVDHSADEDERRGEHVDADTGDVRGGVIAHQFDPEPSDAVGRHVEREQPAMAEPEPAVGPQQEDEHCEVPEKFVEERRMHDSGDLAGGHPVE